jgi:hypothetical protein
MIRPNTKTTCVLAIAFLIPILVLAQNNSNTPSQTPPADPDPLAAVKTARDAAAQDQKTIDADRQTAKTACRNPGADCDAAKTKVQADMARLKTDKEDLKEAVQRAKDSGPASEIVPPPQPKEPPRFKKGGAFR